MITFVIDTPELDSLKREIEAKGEMKLAAVSNAGLPNGKLRLTFLPKEVFEPVNTNNESIDDAMKILLNE